jgi:DNA-binding CsgD family transcriptional regulator
LLNGVLIVAHSTASQRGLASLLDGHPDYRVTERLNWSTPPTLDYAVTLGELEDGQEPVYLTEPFVIVSSQVSLEPGAGRALLRSDACDQTVLTALRAVLLGLSVQDDFHLRGAGQVSQLHDLTPRELDVLSLLGEGHSNKQISQALHISQNTVKFHLSSIFSKLQVGSRAEAVTVGLRSGIILL